MSPLSVKRDLKLLNNVNIYVYVAIHVCSNGMTIDNCYSNFQVPPWP